MLCGDKATLPCPLAIPLTGDVAGLTGVLVALLLHSGRTPISAACDLLSACIAGVADDPCLGVQIRGMRR